MRRFLHHHSHCKTWKVVLCASSWLDMKWKDIFCISSGQDMTKHTMLHFMTGQDKICYVSHHDMTWQDILCAISWQDKIRCDLTKHTISLISFKRHDKTWYHNRTWWDILYICFKMTWQDMSRHIMSLIIRGHDKIYYVFMMTYHKRRLSPTGIKSLSLDDDDDRCQFDMGRSSWKAWAV